jgi:poly-beta-1,6-N-acetyl-D-glucosamine synthase
MDLTGIAVISAETLQIILDDAGVIAIALPVVLLFEVPVTLLVLIGMLKWRWRRESGAQVRIQPKVSCIVTCYSEGPAVANTIISFCEQTYKGPIEIITIIDGATQNNETYEAAIICMETVRAYPNRTLKVVPKWQRGGTVSSLNTGLYASTGEIVIHVDGDSSFDTDAVYELVREFEDPNVPAAAGSLRVRNVKDNLVTRMQGIEYMISMQGGKAGLSEWNLTNNISGAFGAFRRKFLAHIGGWDTHSGEDYDLTIRIKQYFGRQPKMRVPFAARAIGHTDVPSTAKQLINQRIRWDGDLVFLLLRKHKYAFSPRLMGLKTVVFTIVYGILQSVILPIMVVLFNVWIFWVYPTVFVLAILLVQYFMYLILASLMFFAFLAAVSERPREDISMMIWLPIFPIYAFLMRIVTTFAILNEVFRRGHEESGMAPWWVLKRGKRF